MNMEKEDGRATAREVETRPLRDALGLRYSSDPVTATILTCWVDLCEKDDRTSPKDYPDHCLITYDELAGYMRQVAALTGQ